MAIFNKDFFFLKQKTHMILWYLTCDSLQSVQLVVLNQIENIFDLIYLTWFDDPFLQSLLIDVLNAYFVPTLCVHNDEMCVQGENIDKVPAEGICTFVAENNYTYMCRQ